jgi:hypothetical protein
VGGRREIGVTRRRTAARPTDARHHNPTSPRAQPFAKGGVDVARAINRS